MKSWEVINKAGNTVASYGSSLEAVANCPAGCKVVGFDRDGIVFEPGYELEYAVDPHGEIEIVFTPETLDGAPKVNLSDIKRCYVAGPMRGLPLFNFPCFHHAADTLRILGFEVWSPAEKDEQSGFNPATDEAKPLIHYMKEDLPAVLDCDAVVVLDGWENSKGACLEVHVARECGMPILSFPGLEPVL